MADTVKFEIEVSVKCFFEHTVGEKRSKLKETQVFHHCANSIEESVSKNPDGSPTLHGIKNTTIAMLSGLSNNIHYAHQNGLWDSAEQLRFIIDQLEKQFTQVVAADTTEYGKRD